MITILVLILFVVVDYQVFKEAGPFTAGLFLLMFLMMGMLYNNIQQLIFLYKENLSKNK